MNSRATSASKTGEEKSALLREIPPVDEVLSHPKIADVIARCGRPLVTLKTREVLAKLRDSIASGDVVKTPQIDEIVARVASEVENAVLPSLGRVINATGVVLHTNLGRAPLPREAVERLLEVATGYSNLEFDVPGGKRGKRDVHTSRLIADLAGAEAAIVVNNNAAAVFLVLNTLAKGAEVIVSRGELIEIGDGFRIPDIMAESGAVLREVGTTNRTRIADYERSINERTRLLLRVHPSNFRIMGFTERPPLNELVSLGSRYNLPVFEDLGSGCIVDLSARGISEPVVAQSLAAGVPLASFSGDKLLGGPQAGIIVGQKELVERIRKNPLFRALRVDKLTIAVLEATLQAYLRDAIDEIPALSMIRLRPEELARRAAVFVGQTKTRIPAGAWLEMREGFSVIGGGSTPDQQLPAHLIAVLSSRTSAAEIERKLRIRAAGAPVIARIEDNAVILDLRTVSSDEEPELSTAVVEALS